jgi:SAM-dependent methyltransferase
MQRVDSPEILDSDVCSPAEAEAVLRILGRVNRWFGGVATTQRMIERVAGIARSTRLSMLEVAAGSGELSELVQRNAARRGLTLDVTLLDMAPSHLPAKHSNGTGSGSSNRGVVGDALSLPFGDDAFDVVSCNLFAHHLIPEKLQLFFREAERVSRRAVLINDLVRHPLHLALAYAGYPIMLNRVAWLDGLTSVRRAYLPGEMKEILGSAFPTGIRVEISRNYLFRMGVIFWKNGGPGIDGND